METVIWELMFSIHLRKAGYDVLIVEGKADSPTCLYIKDDEVEFLPADEIWGKGTYDSQKWLHEKFGKQVGAMTIGQGGENLVKFAIVRSLEGRAGGRPGMGAVMGSKKLKAIVVKGTKDIPVADPEKMKKDGKEGMKEAYKIDKKIGWSKQAANGVLSWCNETNTLPDRNMRKTSRPDAWKIDGQRLDESRVATYGCPNCTFHCGITIHDSEKRESELDYENIGLLGASLEIFNLQDVGSLNYLCDDYGLDKYERKEMKKVFPDKEFVELPFNHPIYHCHFDFPNGLPKIHEHDKKMPRGYGLFCGKRLCVFYTYETNISDGWTDPEVHKDSPQIRELALKMGTNIVVYALTQ